MWDWAVTVFLPIRKFLLGMFTHPWTVLFSPWTTAAILRITSSGLRSNNVYIQYTPLHTARKLHPSELSWNRSKEKTCSKVLPSWMRRNLGLRIRVWHSRSCEWSFRSGVLNGVGKKRINLHGVYPFDISVCNDLDFLPSQLDDIPLSLQVSEQLKMKWLTNRRLQQAVTVTCGSREECTTSWSQAAGKETMREMKCLP